MHKNQYRCNAQLYKTHSDCGPLTEIVKPVMNTRSVNSQIGRLMLRVIQFIFCSMKCVPNPNFYIINDIIEVTVDYSK